MKVSTKITIFILLSIISYNINGQTTELKEYSKNNVYLDASSLVFFSQISINYERILYNGKNISWYGRLGAGKTILFIDKNRKTNNNKNNHNDDLLIGLTLLTGKYNSHFELDLGTYIGNYNDYSTYPIVDVGYRYQKQTEGINFKITVGSLGFGFGLGYNF